MWASVLRHSIKWTMLRCLMPLSSLISLSRFSSSLAVIFCRVTALMATDVDGCV
jgi:hypothetical protein